MLYAPSDLHDSTPLELLDEVEPGDGGIADKGLSELRRFQLKRRGRRMGRGNEGLEDIHCLLHKLYFDIIDLY